MKYRLEIDGLRAIAVMSVIIYHAEISVGTSTLLPGGYIGVDIFFVISGYLISRIILDELGEKGTFNFLYFYERRIRRIIPMLLTVILVSVPFAWNRLLPTDFLEYSQSVIFAIFFAGNFFFINATAEYGAETALLKPFLHTWSLGVEEQFYIAFPVLLILFHKYLKNYTFTLIVSLFFISLIYLQYIYPLDPQVSFYSPFSRVWELLVGAGLAYIELRHGRANNKILQIIMPVVGLGLISFSLYKFNENTAHPGFLTLLPVFGVSFIIGFSSSVDVVSKILKFRGLTAIGIISYSAYLWHFPIMAFGRLSGEVLDNKDKIIWIILTLILSVVSYYLIEQPFRKPKNISFARLSVGLMIISCFVIIFNIFGIRTNGYEARVPDFLRSGFDKLAFFQVEQEGKACHNRLSDFCVFNPDKEKKIYFIGDSVLGSAMPTILKELSDYEVVYMTNGLCYFSPDTHKYRANGNINKRRCTIEYQNRIYEMLLSEKHPSVVVFGGQLQNYINNNKNFKTLDGTPITAGHLLKHIKILRENSNLRLIFMEPTPSFSGRNYKNALNEALGKGMGALSAFSYKEPRKTYNNSMKKTEPFFQEVERSQLGEVVKQRNTFCDEGNCHASRDGKPVVVDRHHLSEYGASLYIEPLLEMLP